jgi:hypothetical protein
MFNSRAGLHVHGNSVGHLEMAVSWPLRISGRRLVMIFGGPVEIKECAISNVQLLHPYGGRPPLDLAGRSRP